MGHGLNVFPSNKLDALSTSRNSILSALRVMGFERKDMTGHGPEAMARTMIAKRLRYPEAAIELQMAHRVRDIHEHADDRASLLHVRMQLMEERADYLDELKKRRDKLCPCNPNRCRFPGIEPQ